MAIVVVVLLIVIAVFYFQKYQLITTSSIEKEPLKLPFEYQVIPGKDAVETCLQLRMEDQGKFTPVILGDYNDLKNLSEYLESGNFSPAEIIKKSLNLNIDTLSQSRIAQVPEYYQDVPLGVWPEKLTPLSKLTAHTDILSGRPLKEVYIGLIPAVNSYRNPGLFKLRELERMPQSGTTGWYFAGLAPEIRRRSYFHKTGSIGVYGGKSSPNQGRSR